MFDSPAVGRRGFVPAHGGRDFAAADAGRAASDLGHARLKGRGFFRLPVAGAGPGGKSQFLASKSVEE